MNTLVVPVTGVKFNSAFCMRNKQWVYYENFSSLLCILTDWKSLSGRNFLEDIYIKLGRQYNQEHRTFRNIPEHEKKIHEKNIK